MKEIESNKDAWEKIAEDHYRAFKQALENGTHRLNLYIQEELGDITSKSVIHLQCNTGADTILLARKAAHVTGVDLVPENIRFADKMVRELGVGNVDFIESDIMTLSEIHREKYDVVFTSEGVLGWLPDLRVWARTIRQLLKDDGFVYVFDSHPFALMFDEEKLSREKYDIRYPYFSEQPDADDSVGGYVSEPKQGVKAYFWSIPSRISSTPFWKPGCGSNFSTSFLKPSTMREACSLPGKLACTVMATIWTNSRCHSV